MNHHKLNEALATKAENTPRQDAPAQTQGGSGQQVVVPPRTPHQAIEQMIPQMERALPGMISADRMARIALTEVKNTKHLGEANLQTFTGALMNCVQLGLEPGGAAGEAYLLPFWHKKHKEYQVQLVIGYKGMLKLFWQHPLAAGIDVQAVRERDAFDYEYGTQRYLRHKPARGARGRVTDYYAVAHLANGGFVFLVMEPDEIEEHRLQSKQADSGPWRDHYREMAKKTVIRSLFKLLPKSPELAQALAHDESVRTDITADGVHARPALPPAPEGGERVQTPGPQAARGESEEARDV